MGGEVTVAGPGVQGKLVVDRHLVPRLWRAGGRGEQPGHWLRGWAGPCNLQGGQPGLGDRLKGWTGLLATDTHPCCLLLAQTLQEGGNGGFPSWQHGAVEGGQGQGAAVPGTGEEGGGPGQGGQAVREEAQSQQEERGGEAPPVLLASLATTAALATPSPPDPPDPFAHPTPNAPSAPSCPSCPPSSPACPASLAPSVLTLLSSGATAHLGRARVGDKVYLGVQTLSTCIQAE